MEKVCEVVKKPITIGVASQGFLIPKENVRLKSRKNYKIVVYELDNYIDALSIGKSGGSKNGL